MNRRCKWTDRRRNRENPETGRGKREDNIIGPRTKQQKPEKGNGEHMRRKYRNQGLISATTLKDPRNLDRNKWENHDRPITAKEEWGENARKYSAARASPYAKIHRKWTT